MVWSIVDLIAVISFGLLAYFSISISKKIGDFEYTLLTSSFIAISLGFLIDAFSSLLGLYKVINGIYTTPKQYFNIHGYFISITLVFFIIGFSLLIITVRRFSTMVFLPCSIFLLNSILATLLLFLSGIIIYLEKNIVLRKPTKMSFLFLALSHLSLNFMRFMNFEFITIPLLFRTIAVVLITYAVVKGAFCHG